MAEKTINLSTVNRFRSSADVGFGDVWYQPGSVLGPRRQMDYQLFIILAGNASIRCDDEEFNVPTGGVTLLRPGRRELFHFARHQRTRHTWCAVRPGLVPAAMRRRLQKLPSVLPQSHTFGHLMQGAFGMVQWKGDAANRVLGQIALSLLLEYERMAASGAGESEASSPWMIARDHLEAHFAEADCLGRAASAAGVTPQHLNRLFRAHFASTPGRYLWEQRVAHGVRLLVETGLRISEIAERCGFKNAFHFSRLVRARHQAPPREVRRRAWNLR